MVNFLAVSVVLVKFSPVLVSRADHVALMAHCGGLWYEFLVGHMKKDSIYVLRRGYIDLPSISGPDRQSRMMDWHLICLSKK
jgi:hypothetical protein